MLGRIRNQSRTNCSGFVKFKVYGENSIANEPAHAIASAYAMHNVGRRYVGMARMPASCNTFSKPPNSQTKKL